MGLKECLDSKVKKLSWADVALVKFSCIVFGIMIAALIPALIEINLLWLAAVFVILAIKPAYTAFK